MRAERVPQAAGNIEPVIADQFLFHDGSPIPGAVRIAFLKPQRLWKRPQRLSAMTPSIRRTAIRKKTSVANIAATPSTVPMPR